MRSRKKQLEQVETELKLLEKLGSTDRAVLLFGFKVLFPILATICLFLAGSSFLELQQGPVNEKTAIGSMVWSIAGIVSVWATTVFKKLEDPQPSLDGLRKRIKELKNEEKRPS